MPIPALAGPSAPGLALYREKVRPRSGRETGLGQVQVPREAGEGETAPRSRDWPGPCRERPVHSSGSYGYPFRSTAASSHTSPSPASGIPARNPG